jgi:hypothetical protein
VTAARPAGAGHAKMLKSMALRPYRTYHDAYDAARGLFFFSLAWGFE